MRKVLLAGNSVTAEIMSAYLLRDSRYDLLGCMVDDEYVHLGGLGDYPTLPLSQLSTTHSPSDISIIMAIGYDNLNRSREKMFSRLKELGYRIETYIHPDARVYTEHELGEGCVILPNAVIEPDARVGSNTMLWTNVTLAHHSSVSEHCWVAAGAVISGQASVARNSFLGVNSTVVNAVEVSDFNIVGAGAMISRNTRAYSVHLARSAELVRYSSEEYARHFGM